MPKPGEPWHGALVYGQGSAQALLTLLLPWLIILVSVSAGCEYQILGKVLQEELLLPLQCCTALTGDGHAEVDNEHDGVLYT